MEQRRGVRSRHADGGVPAGTVQETKDGARGGRAVRWKNCQALGSSGGEGEILTREWKALLCPSSGKGHNQATKANKGITGASCGVSGL